LVINWLKRQDRQLNAIGGSELQLLLGALPADSAAETAEFDNEVRRAMFNHAAEQVRGEVQVLTWEAFWETAVLGNSPSTAAEKLKISIGAVRVAKCRVLARLQIAVRKMEQSNAR
jgi:RNA polymerase sigma-70 factor (ECF subfamily)